MNPPKRLAVLFVLGLLFLFGSAKITEQLLQYHGQEKYVAGEDIEGHFEWFQLQRAYPFGSIPENARRQAWEQTSQGTFKTLQVSDSRIWRPIGPSPTVDIRPNFPKEWQINSGRINSIAVSPADSQIILIGSASGGIWRSIDGGANFVPVTDDQVDLAVGSIAFSKSEPSIVYAGMGDGNAFYQGNGVLKSSDGGQSWARIDRNGLPANGLTRRIEVDPSSPNRVYLALIYYAPHEGAIFNLQYAGFYVSTDGGVNWSNTLAGGATDFAIDPTDAKTIYLAVRAQVSPSFGPGGVLKSIDSGKTWTRILTVGVDPDNVKISASASNPSKVFVITQRSGDSNPQLYVSVDGGANWTSKTANEVYPNQFWYNSVLAVDPLDPNTLHLGTTDLFKSIDGGTSWSNDNQPFPKVHVDQHAFCYSPSNPNVIYVGNDGGLWKSTDRGASFVSLNHTLSLTQFYSIAVGPTDPLLVYGGTQDNGTQVRLSGASKNWTWFDGGDGGNCVVNPQNADVVFTISQGGLISRWKDKGFTQYITGNNINNAIAWPAKLGDPFPNRVAFIPPLVGNGVDATLYFGTWRLYIGTDLGDTWTAPAGLTDLTKGAEPTFGFDVLSTIAVARSDTKVIYTGSFLGRAMASTDGGKNWLDVTAGLPNRSIKSITIEPSNPSVAYLTVSGFGSGHVFKTINTGTTWIDISGNLPNIPTNALLIDPLNPNILYVGTDIGVFRSTAGGMNWEMFNNGMPPAIVTAFAAQSNGLIRVATFGRGAYELRDPALDPSITSVNFNGKKNLTIQGSRFGNSPIVLINDTNRNEFIKSSSDTSINLKAKSKKLGLKTGQNTVQIIDATGASSNKFVIEL